MTEADRKKRSRRDKPEKPWTFITNYAAVLSLLANHPRITAREIAEEVGITERSIRFIISDLDGAGYISKVREGRNILYRVDVKRSMRHKTQRDIAVSDLLSVLSKERSSVKKSSIS
jgi:DNA-binding transcriptional ArsR family regulator